MRARLPLLGLALLAACGGEPAAAPVQAPPRTLAFERYRTSWDAAERASAIAEGRDVLGRLECTRCHTIDDLEPAARPAHCVSCHVFLDGLSPGDRHWQTLSSRYGEDTLRRYQRNIHHFEAVPDLTGIARRLRPEFIRTFVAAPFDVRPTMEETMVRVRVTDDELRAIVRYFAAVAEVADPYTDRDPPAAPALVRDDARVARGRQLFQERGCNVCHYVGNIDLGRTEAQIRAGGTAAMLAPNLRFVRDRMHPDVVVDWILDPQRIAPGTPMPNLHVGREDAEVIRDFLWFADPELEPTPEKAPFVLPPAVPRQVSWEEVDERVLGRVCVHCHMNDHERDRGPGNQGGWGWPGEHVRFRTYEMLVAGMPGIEDRNWSLMETWQDANMPILLEVMLRRRDEERRDHVLPFHDHERPEYADHEPGMPMGLPSMTDEEIGIVRAWIEQGCPGPTAVTGMPGITDGFLVPDGPIAINHGCQVRAPAETRPEWSTHPPPEWARDTPPVRPSP
jgi:cytochrome c5